MQHKAILGAAIAAALMTLGAGVQAQQYTTTTRTTVITTAPPTRTEVVPAPRSGWIWAPGHYEWRGGEYAWNEGHWLRDRAGYEYREPRWVQRGNGEWMLVGNSWERRMHRDRDHDGIANRNDRDIDGDGVPNRRDAHPRNPNRS